MKLNPKVSEYLKESPDKTLLGLAWSCWWRLYVVVLAVYLGILVVIGLIGVALGGY